MNWKKNIMNEGLICEKIFEMLMLHKEKIYYIGYFKVGVIGGNVGRTSVISPTLT